MSKLHDIIAVRAATNASDYSGGAVFKRKEKMEDEYYNLDNTEFEVTDLICKKGQFTNEEGKSFDYKLYYIKVKINDYPMEFKFKLDKVFNEYIGDALSNKGE